MENNCSSEIYGSRSSVTTEVMIDENGREGCMETHGAVNTAESEGPTSNNVGVSKSGEEASASSVDQPLDRLTALEMLQLLKEYKKRELLYVFQITTLQKELHLKQTDTAAAAETPSALAYHNSKAALLDPTVNLEIRELRLRLLEKDTELQKAKDELKASSFSADSVMGRRLISKCKTLQDENTDIGKMLLENQLQPLQLQIGILQKQLAFFKKQLVVLHQLNADLDRDNQLIVRQLHEITVLYKETQQERDQLKTQQLLQHREGTKHRDANGDFRDAPRRSVSRENLRRDGQSGRSSSRHLSTRRSSRKRSTDRMEDNPAPTTASGSRTRSRSGGSQTTRHRSSRRQSPSSRSSRREGGGEPSSRRTTRDWSADARSPSNAGESRRRRAE